MLRRGRHPRFSAFKRRRTPASSFKLITIVVYYNLYQNTKSKKEYKPKVDAKKPKTKAELKEKKAANKQKREDKGNASMSMK